MLLTDTDHQRPTPNIDLEHLQNYSNHSLRHMTRSMVVFASTHRIVFVIFKTVEEWNPEVLGGENFEDVYSERGLNNSIIIISDCEAVEVGGM